MKSGFRKLLAVPAVLLFLAGCSVEPTYTVKFDLPGENIDCGNMEVSFISYDYQAVLDSLKNKNNPGPRPDSVEFLNLYEQYQSALPQKTRMDDSVSTLRDQLAQMDIRSIEYRKMHPIIVNLEKESDALNDEFLKLHRSFTAARSEYLTALREWEAKAYEGFVEFRDNLSEREQTIVETTDMDCLVAPFRLPSLPRGQWTLHAEITIPGTPQKWVWEMPVPKEGPDTLNIILNDGNAKTETVY